MPLGGLLRQFGLDLCSAKLWGRMPMWANTSREKLVLRDAEVVANVNHPLIQTGYQPFSLDAISIILCEIDLLIGILIEVEQQPGKVFEGHVLPAVPSHQPAVRRIDTVVVPRRD